MAAGAAAHADPTYGPRARKIWIVMSLSTVLFCALCAAAGTGAYGYLNSVTQSEHATLEKIRGSQVLVQRKGSLNTEAVENSTTVNEGDEIKTGPDTEANLVLFDRSTLHLFFSTDIKLERLRATRFLGSREELRISVTDGTIVLSTASGAGADYAAADYSLSTPEGELAAGRDSTVRVQVDSQSDNPTVQMVVSFGSASVMSSGKLVELHPGEMTVVGSDGVPADARPVEQELIRNGTFREAATSGKETSEGGGLDTAAWQPIIEQPGDNTGGQPSTSIPVTITSESLAGQSTRAARLQRDAQNGLYARIGLRQDINSPASFFRFIELRASVKVVQQTEPVGGPQGDVFPLTIKVLYTDTDGKPQSWQQSFYWGDGVVDAGNTTTVPLGAWTPIPPDKPDSKREQFVLKRSDLQPNTTQAIKGQNISVINAVEIYGIGDRLQAWITDVSLLAR